ncbi:MAG: putative family exoprotein [Labilithrix sp.]|nr:putative family exoprotein [Labilithrix sp.]
MHAAEIVRSQVFVSARMPALFGLIAAMLIGCGSDSDSDVTKSSKSLVSTSAESTNCPNGGYRIEVGLDDGSPDGIAGDGVLSPGEVDSTAVVCNGQDGKDGSNGTIGPKGTDGTDGTNGANGHNSLIQVSAAGAGCPAGGSKIEVGIDDGTGAGDPDDGALSLDEVDQTRFVCDGVSPAACTLSVEGTAQKLTCPDGTIVKWWPFSLHSRPLLDTGNLHTCGVRPNGTVACWGSSGYGQTTAPAGTFTSVSAGTNHTCGVKTDGTVACWGSNGYGEATAPAGTFTSVSAGSAHTCGVKTDGTVACWGSNGYGEATAPVGTFTSVSAGGVHTCGVKTDGMVACWGDGNLGQKTVPAGFPE